MKILIIYYSRTGTVRKVAEKLKEKLNCGLEEIKDLANRQGTLGYLKSGKEATMEKPVKIEEIKNKIEDCDLVIIGTPVWAYNMCSPVRACLINNKDKFKKVAFFCVQGGSGSERVFKKMEELINQKPLATLALLTKEVATNDFEAKLENFINSLK
jgi:flavodoxin